MLNLHCEQFHFWLRATFIGDEYRKIGRRKDNEIGGARFFSASKKPQSPFTRSDLPISNVHTEQLTGKTSLYGGYGSGCDVADNLKFGF